MKYWYQNQNNSVRWAGAYSEEYRLECGVRQGGLTSPRLFNLYINSLIEELTGAGIGCSVGGKIMNNISYADDMALLSPSIGALEILIGICERYAETHGLRYNSKKSELLVFKAGSKKPKFIPPLKLGGTELKNVTQFKYLGHWVTEDLSDDLDVERERRALAVRSNMLARRFARCTKSVKITLFRAFCQSFYTCGLWVKCTQKSLNALRIQYNNGFRVFLGLPRFCSASGMFAEAHVDSFQAIMRKRVASLMRRVRVSPNSLLNTVIDSLDCPIVAKWNAMHMNKLSNRGVVGLF
ncbi:uncharacterized protein LOC133529924 [Cydia pomonella]|uniref:uncharacterized protein LOC133529924 n=1 Tax=Cydia pomonella TaxID=82600 RepID=UPI002ADDCF92|nr:uncharacterized protein LOC133529924 [Cydia pomonella]